MSYFLKHCVIMTSVGVILRLNACLKVLCWDKSEIQIFTHIDQVWNLTRTGSSGAWGRIKIRHFHLQLTVKNTFRLNAPKMIISNHEQCKRYIKDSFSPDTCWNTAIRWSINGITFDLSTSVKIYLIDKLKNTSTSLQTQSDVPVERIDHIFLYM